MSRLHVSARVALAGSLLTLLLVAGAAAAAGYLVEAHAERADRDRRVTEARAFVQLTEAQAETSGWQQAMARKLAALGLGASVTLIGPPDGKRLLYNGSTTKHPADVQPTATYTIRVADGSGRALLLDLYAPAFDQARRALVALAAGIAALLAGMAILIWAASRWLVTPLRRLNAQVDAIAGGDPIESRASSPIQEVQHVAAAVEGMAATLAQAGQREARLEAGRRLLVGSIAHDLRTPLFSLRGYLDAIAAGIGNPRERLDQARAKADQIDRLVTSLFDYTRADIDQRPQPQTTDLAEAVTDATAALEIAAHERGVRLRVTALTSPAVSIGRTALERALTNVLDNALRHTPRGGAIDVTCGDDTDGPFVQVVDDGPGIATDLLPRLFEPIDRADTTRNGPPDGAGLGLTIAARLLRNQGGTIDAGNTPGRGANLTLRIPSAPIEVQTN